MDFSHEEYLASLTEEQKTLLAEFQLRPISAPEDTPVLWVGRAPIKDKDDLRSTTSSTDSSHGSSEFMCCQRHDSASPHLNPVKGLHSSPTDATNGEQIESPLVPSSLAQHNSSAANAAKESNTRKGEKVRSAPELQEEPFLTTSSEAARAVAYVEALPSGEDTEEDAKNESKILHNMRLESALPLLYNRATSGGVSDPAAVPRYTSSAPPCASPSDTVGKDTDAEKSIDERCQGLADRLLRMSAEVEAVELKMDHTILPPSEFL